MDVNATVDVCADRDAVWAVLADVERLGEWMTVHDSFDEEPPADLDAGVEISQRVTAENLDAAVEWVVEVFEAPERMAWQGRGPGGSELHAVYRLEATEEGTRVECCTTVDLPGGPVGGLAGRAAAPRARVEAERSLERLRDLVETTAAA